MSFKNIIINQWANDLGRVMRDIHALNVLRNNTEDLSALQDRYFNICTAIAANNGKISRGEALTFLDGGKNLPFLIESLTENYPMCALEIYHAYYAGDNSKLLSYTDIDSNPVITQVYMDLGANSIGFAGATAVYWHLSELC